MRVRGLCPLHYVCATLLLTVPLPRCFARGGHPLTCVEDGRVNNTLHKISLRLSAGKNVTDGGQGQRALTVILTLLQSPLTFLFFFAGMNGRGQ